MPEGLYQLPDGLRLRWATSTMWVTYKAGDCRRRVYRAITLQRPGAAKTEHAGVPSKKQPLRRWGYTFSWDGKALHVRR